MSKRFGKRRSVDCRCDYNFTCAACCADAAERNQADRNTLGPVAR